MNTTQTVWLRPAARHAFWAAAALGTLHAAWSIYWAFGGQFLLATVGQWAVEATTEPPGLALVGLLLISALKLAGAWLPLLAETRRVPGRRGWRVLAWIGGPFLILYGGADFVAGAAVLMGLIQVEETDSSALVGHAFIWGPHFALWGAALTTALFLSRESRAAPPPLD